MAVIKIKAYDVSQIMLPLIFILNSVFRRFLYFFEMNHFCKPLFLPQKKYIDFILYSLAIFALTQVDLEKTLKINGTVKFKMTII